MVSDFNKILIIFQDKLFYGEKNELWKNMIMTPNCNEKEMKKLQSVLLGLEKKNVELYELIIWLSDQQKSQMSFSIWFTNLNYYMRVTV